MSILETIHDHDDLIRLSDSQRTLLCQEIRRFLIDNVSKTGGHLASNLGAVELTVAIETVFDTMYDRLVFDVGHQSYVHKLLTGRQAEFPRLRQYGGISGFPKPHESEADAFVAGHASSSVSIGLGMARARTLLGRDYHVITLLGDGAATGGMIYEGLNDAAESREPMIIILNDNEMSIDKNVGGLSSHLSRLRAKEQYLGFKQRYRRLMGKTKAGQLIYRVSKGFKDRIKRMLLPSTIFENMGLTYLGPVDGHDLPGLITLLNTAKAMRSPVVLHVLTEKGRGYSPAEKDPAKFHGIGPFDPVSGCTLGSRKISFSDSFGNEMLELAALDQRVCAITAAMPGGVGLLEFKQKFPRRLFDVGIAEEHAVSMAGGLAKQGMIPVVAIYSTFLQRSYDQIMQDVALQKLHVVFAVDRAGLVGEDGATHHGVFDVGFLRQMPGMMVLAPSSLEEQRQMLRWAVTDCVGPVAIRYPRGGNGEFTGSCWDPACGMVSHRPGINGVILTYGTMLNQALSAAEHLKNNDLDISVQRLTRLDHFYRADIASLAAYRHIFVLEEACSGSGIYEAVAAAINGHSSGCLVHRLDLGNEFIPHGSMELLYRNYRLDAASVADHISEVLSNEN